MYAYYFYHSSLWLFQLAASPTTYVRVCVCVCVCVCVSRDRLENILSARTNKCKKKKNTNPEQQPRIWSSVGIFTPNRGDTCIEVAPDWPCVCAAARLGGHYNTDNTAVSSYNRCPRFSVFLKFQQRLQYDHGKKKKIAGQEEER